MGGCKGTESNKSTLGQGNVTPVDVRTRYLLQSVYPPVANYFPGKTFFCGQQRGREVFSESACIRGRVCVGNRKLFPHADKPIRLIFIPLFSVGFCSSLPQWPAQPHQATGARARIHSSCRPVEKQARTRTIHILPMD